MKIIQRLPGLEVLKSTKDCGISLHQSHATGPDSFFFSFFSFFWEQQMFIYTLVPFKTSIHSRRVKKTTCGGGIALFSRRCVGNCEIPGPDLAMTFERRWRTAGPGERFSSHYAAGQRREINVRDKTQLPRDFFLGPVAFMARG